MGSLGHDGLPRSPPLEVDEPEAPGSDDIASERSRLGWAVMELQARIGGIGHECFERYVT